MFSSRVIQFARSHARRTLLISNLISVIRYSELICKRWTFLRAKPIIKIKKSLETRFARVRTRETNFGNFVADCMKSLTDSDCALVNSGTFRSGVGIFSLFWVRRYESYKVSHNIPERPNFSSRRAHLGRFEHHFTNAWSCSTNESSGSNFATSSRKRSFKVSDNGRSLCPSLGFELFIPARWRTKSTISANKWRRVGRKSDLFRKSSKSLSN